MSCFCARRANATGKKEILYIYLHHFLRYFKWKMKNFSKKMYNSNIFRVIEKILGGFCAVFERGWHRSFFLTV